MEFNFLFTRVENMGRIVKAVINVAVSMSWKKMKKKNDFRFWHLEYLDCTVRYFVLQENLINFLSFVAYTREIEFYS